MHGPREPQLSHPLTEGSWNLWAHRVISHDGRVVYHHTGEKWWTKMCDEEGDLVAVRLTPNPEGDYWAWMDSEDDFSFPGMIWPDKGLFRMCFANGPEPVIAQLEKIGEIGKVVRLDVIERDDDETDSPRLPR